MRENCTPGSVRGALGNRCPYREPNGVKPVLKQNVIEIFVLVRVTSWIVF